MYEAATAATNEMLDDYGVLDPETRSQMGVKDPNGLREEVAE